MENLSQLIHRLGINATYRGYHYLYRAVLLALSDEDYLLSITKKMYLDIAAYYGIPVSNVKRNLRTVITICWERGNREFLTEIASYPLTFRPSAGNSSIFSLHIAGASNQRMIWLHIVHAFFKSET